MIDEACYAFCQKRRTRERGPMPQAIVGGGLNKRA